jgi:hypothetical protein
METAMEEDTVRMTLLTGPHRGCFYCIRAGTPCDLGRADDCPVKLSGESLDDLTSRHHCRFTFDGGCVRLQDLGSKNGTYLNGQRIEPEDGTRAPCRHRRSPSRLVDVEQGDVVMIGATSMRVELISCPGRSPASGGTKAMWKPGQTVRENCPLRC